MNVGAKGNIKKGDGDRRMCAQISFTWGPIVGAPVRGPTDDW